MNTNLLKHLIFISSLILLVGLGCEQPDKLAKYKIEVLKAESNFTLMAREKGLSEAFSHFAAADAVLNRNDSIIKGRKAIKNYFEKQELKEVKLQWEPDFVEVSLSGDLAYTYGKYIFRAVDTNGRVISTQGVFHTVWKRQQDGSWKFVYD